MSRTAKHSHAALVLVLLGAVLVLVVLWYTLLDGPRSQLAAQRLAADAASAKLDTARKQIGDAAKTKAAIDVATLRVQEMEKKIPAGDPYRWLIKAFLDFPAATNVSLANIEPPHVSESVLLPKVPYKTATFTLTGSGYYHGFGVFLAAVENHFPHMRIRRVDLNPGYPGEADSPETERLNFQVEVAALFKAAPSLPPAQLSLRPSGEKRN